MAQKRVGLKQVAELAGMSVGNVSMVLSGRGEEARISKSSQQRVFEAAKQLQYKPNVYAKRLRIQNADRLIIAVFFAPTRHVAIVGSFFAGIHNLLASDDDNMIKPEIVLYPYTQGCLRDIDELIHQVCFNGAIFMGMSPEDFDYLESLEISAPIVLFNRISSRHHYVYVDNASIGQTAARIFHEKGFRNVCLVTGRQLSVAGSERRQGFIDECEKLGLALPQEHILSVGSRQEGGKEAAHLMMEKQELPDGVFFSEDIMGLGALHWLLVKGVQVPSQISLLCYSGGSRNEEYTIPALSTISMPMEEMSRDCLVLLNQAIQKPECGQLNMVHKPVLNMRESII